MKTKVQKLFDAEMAEIRAHTVALQIRGGATPERAGEMVDTIIAVIRDAFNQGQLRWSIIGGKIALNKNDIERLKEYARKHHQ